MFFYPMITKNFWGFISRLVLSCVFFVSGFSGLFGLPEISVFSPDGIILDGPLNESPLFYALKTTELMISFLLLGNIFIPTALIMLTPIISTVVIYNFSVEITHGFVSMLLIIPLGILFSIHRDIFKVFFKHQYLRSHYQEEGVKVISYEEVSEKAPKLKEKFGMIYRQTKDIA